MVIEAGWQTISSVEEGLRATLKLARANVQAYDKRLQQRLAALSHELTLDAC